MEMLGNERPNLLDGTDGSDVFRGKGGGDVLLGSAQFNGDQVDYEDSPTAVVVDLQRGFGRLGHAEGGSYIGIESARGSRFDDQFTGNDAADNLFFGGEGDDSFISSGGANSYFGGGGRDTVSYSQSSTGVTVDLARTGRGGDAEGDEYVGVENVVGSRGDDVLRGDSNNNILTGEVGNDRLFGGAGDDTFVISAAIGGSETVEDFSTAGDLLRVLDPAFGTTFDDLKANNLRQVGDDALLDFGGGNSVTLLGVDVDDLSANDFVFG